MEINKIFKRLLWLSGAVATVFAIVFAMGKFDGEKAAAAVELNQGGKVSYIDSVSIKVTHKDNSTQMLDSGDTYTVRDGDRTELNYTFSFPDNVKISAGDTYTVYVPRTFAAYNDADGNLQNGDGVVFGTWKLSHSLDNAHNGYPLVMTFNDRIETVQGRKGTVTLNSSFDMQHFTEENRQEIQIPLKNSTTFTVHLKQNTGDKYGDVDKNGCFYGDEWKPEKAHYTIDFNKNLNDIDNPVLADTSLQGRNNDGFYYTEQKIDYSSIKVYGVHLDEKGKIITNNKDDSLNPRQVSTSEYWIEKSSDSRSFKIHFNHKIMTAYRVEYDASVNGRDTDGRESTTVRNDVTLYDGSGNKLASDSVRLNANWWSRNSTIHKTGSQDGTGKVKWDIFYNLANHSFNDGNTVVTDTLQYNGSFDRNSFVICEASAKDSNPWNVSSANIQLGRKLSSSEYRINYSKDNYGHEVARITIYNSNGRGYKISYDTSIPAGLKNNDRLGNKAEDNHGNNPAGGDVWFNDTSERIRKDTTGITDKTIDWRVQFWEAADENVFKSFRNLTLTDHFYTDKAGAIDKLDLKDGLTGVEVYRSQGVGDWNAGIRIDPSQYTIVTDNRSGAYKGFRITFKNEMPAALYEVRYTTTRDASLKAGNWAQFGNANVERNVEAGPPAADIKKSNSGINADDNLLYWNVTVNEENKVRMKNYSVRDTITGDQTIDMSTLRVLDVTAGNRDVTRQVRAELTDTTSTYRTGDVSGDWNNLKEYTSPAKLLTVHLPDTNHVYRITYGVKLGPRGYDPDWKVYWDYAGLYRDSENVGNAKSSYYTWKTILDKSGEVNKADNSLVDWKIDLNKSYIDYPNGAIRDTLDGKQMFVEDSVRIYRYESDDKVSRTPLPKSAYNVEFAPVTVNGVTTQQMVITFNDGDRNGNPGEKAGHVSRPYHVEYQTKLLTSGKDHVSNTAAIEGLDNKIVYFKKDCEKEVKHTSGDATITGYNVDFDILKRDAITKDVMRDVHFDLYRLVDGKWAPYIKDMTTGSNGRISYDGLFTGRYKLVETKTQSKYTKLSEPVYFTLGKKNMNDDNDKESTITITDANGNAVNGNRTAFLSVTPKNSAKHKPTTLQVLNIPVGGVLPHTGGPGRTLFEAFGSLTIVIACAAVEVVIWRRIRKSREV